MGRDLTRPYGTPAQPETNVDHGEETVSRVKSVVSREGIVPEKRDRRPKPERLRTTRINDSSASERS